MSKNVGRGRGWLNLSKTQNATNVSRVGNPSTVTSVANTDDIQFIDAVNHFKDLINKIKQINVNDDGINLNQKMKYILEDWKQSCDSGKQVETSFDTIYEECLRDTDLASKLVLMVSARSFITQEVHDQNIRLMFLRKLQDNIESGKQLQQSKPIAFRNSVQILGEFFNKARLANGHQLTFMATPLLISLDMLLESGTLQDIQLFTRQLCLNGAAIKSKAENPEKLVEILNTARLKLVSDNNLTKEAKLWLLLALDAANHRFGLFPSEIYKFYQDNLGDAALSTFQVTHGTLTVQTSDDNKTSDNYQSNVQVLQMSEPIQEPVSSPSCTSSSDYNTSSSFQSDNSTSNRGNSGKFGRPILGVGARLNKSKQSNDSNWREPGWNNNQNKGNWSENKKNSKQGAKGWEHDDRFDNDYS